MTAPVAALVTPLPSPDLTRWVSWLRDQIDPNWRSGEWFGEDWYFVGDPDNEQTIAYWCRTTACTSISNSRGFCTPCIREQAATGLSVEEFADTYVPMRRKGSPGRFQRRCVVERDGTQCADPSYCRRLCVNHYHAWHTASKREPELDLDEWLSTVPQPRPGRAGTCSVRRCGMELWGLKTLCIYHDAKYRREARHEPVERWITTQTPFLYAHHFSLLPLNPTLRWEVLYALQQRDARGGKVDPTCVRALVRTFTDLPHMLGTNRAELLALSGHRKSANNLAHLTELHRALHLGYDKMCGISPTDKHVWDMAAAKIASANSKSGRLRRIAAEPVDFTTISQAWLRDVALEWARQTDPTSDALKEAIKASVIASRALERRTGGGHDATQLRLDDMDAVMAGFRQACREDGQPYKNSTLRNYVAKFFQLLEFGRRAGLMDEVPGGFSRHQSHVIPHEEQNEDEIGKAIPEPVIAQLDTQLDTLGTSFPYGKLLDDEIRHMFRTAYTLLRDTGRRPREICALRVNCLEHDDGHNLVWNNFKGKRLRRRLPITSQTAQAIRDWLPVRQQLLAPKRTADYLFPAITEGAKEPFMASGYLSKALRDWVDALPSIDSNVPGRDGSPLPFDRSLIYPYAFRHSYAQRHADAGVAVDVLKELMDHRQINTTMGYYTVSLKRKREAVNTMRRLVVDRNGNPAPVTSATAYEARSVAVPFGNCIEPSNVKAGGQACPIRFQCSGCGFYRPDPSYLPAIEEHTNALRADRETALAMDAADFVIRNLGEQITSFEQVRDTMREGLAAMDPQDRQEIEEASAVLRKTRAGQGRTTLPLTVIHREAPDGA
ncbi:Phage integrase family protein [Lentzea albidocapillata subsp. violacea]|uniref:Phage integrase family protein n=1 Tax=Lentzea albidocapillata subsp. violacea TaxID=128104 RepID=A0A1G9HJT2_9PSEU|nr:site-specific integrase [Lentzea albidocapillata]SDL13217.1 Phage integrase family protein [Lentzea albidocapillata subsp. violacea]